mmetsp:Transcript_18282/g.42784  ORF Transcript_18282/g.42784 Transcript_18282/m.42784 type:complete len:202 (-) Transcript_18282:416-1021(-)
MSQERTTNAPGVLEWHWHRGLFDFRQPLPCHRHPCKAVSECDSEGGSHWGLLLSAIYDPALALPFTIRSMHPNDGRSPINSRVDPEVVPGVQTQVEVLLRELSKDHFEAVRLRFLVVLHGLLLLEACPRTTHKELAIIWQLFELLFQRLCSVAPLALIDVAGNGVVCERLSQSVGSVLASVRPDWLTAQVVNGTKRDRTLD